MTTSKRTEINCLENVSKSFQSNCTGSSTDLKQWIAIGIVSLAKDVVETD